jgi:hypothetical protein
MTQDPRFKKAVRARMAETGEKYTQARRALLTPSGHGRTDVTSKLPSIAPSSSSIVTRWDETWHRLHEWTNGQAPAERLAAQVLLAEDFSSLDPSHPLGGPDRGKDALLTKDGARWVMAVYFPRGSQRFTDIKKKFLADHEGVAANDASGMAFVTNQELTLDQRKQLRESVTTPVEIFHVERVTAILDQPAMHSVRAQFLQISAAAPLVAEELPTPRTILDAATPPPGAPDHWMVYDGMLLLRVVAVPAPAGLRHPEASDPRSALAEASTRAGELAASWPSQVSLLAHRLAEGWQPMAPHVWGAGRTFSDAGMLARHPSAATSFVTRSAVLCVDRTWATQIYDDDEEFSFNAAREPEVAAELLVSLGVAASLLESLSGLTGVDIVVQIAAAPLGTTLVASERAVSGGRFGEPEGSLRSPAAEVRSHYLDSARFALDELRDPYRAAEQLIGPWLATFRSDDLFARLRDS